MAADQTEITNAVARLREYAGQLPYVVDGALPPGYVFVEGQDEGLAMGYPLKPVRDSIDNILEAFDQLQRAMGETHTRHERFLTGKCR